jgi:glutamate transport system substrate-binding protein
MRMRSLAAIALVGMVAATVPAAAAPRPKATKPKATKKGAATTVAPTTAAPATTAAAAATTVAAAPKSGLPATAEKIKAKGKIRIGVKFDVPFMGLKNAVTGNLDGFDTEMGKIIARKIFGTDKDKIEWVEAISRNREPFITDDKVDIVISTYTINDARKKIVDFAGPYVSARQDILIYKVDASSIKSVDDLNGRKVCSVQGSTSLNNLKAKAPRADVVAFNTYSECVEALKDGRVDAVTTDDLILISFAKKFPAFQLVGKPFSDEPYGIGLKRCDNDFRTWINDTVDESVKNGDYKKAWDAPNSIGDAGLPLNNPPKTDRYAAAGC